MCLPSRSGLKTDFRMLHCGTSWYDGLGSPRPGKWEDFPETLLVSFESEDGSGVLKMDQPLLSVGSMRETESA